MTVTPLQIRKTLEALAILPNNIQNQTGSPSACGVTDVEGNIAYFNKLCIQTINGSPPGGASFPLIAGCSTVDSYLWPSFTPPYTFTDQHTGIFQDCSIPGSIGMLSDAGDGTSRYFWSERPWQVFGTLPADGGRLISMPRHVGIGWTDNDLNPTPNQYLTFFSMDTTSMIISLVTENASQGAGLRILQHYDKTGAVANKYLEINCNYLPDFYITTDNNAGTAPNLIVMPVGDLKLRSASGGTAYYWGIQASNNQAFVPFANNAQDIGTAALKVRNLYLNNPLPSLTQIGQFQGSPTTAINASTTTATPITVTGTFKGSGRYSFAFLQTILQHTTASAFAYIWMYVDGASIGVFSTIFFPANNSNMAVNIVCPLGGITPGSHTITLYLQTNVGTVTLVAQVQSQMWVYESQ